MGRHTKNDSEESSIAWIKNSEFKLFKVKTPFFSKVTFKIVVGIDKKGKEYHATSDEIVKHSISEKNKIIKEFRDKGMEVINIEENAIKFPDICEKCHRKGIPKIEKKSNKYDYHSRVLHTFTEDSKHKIEVNRPDEHWLTYDHNKKPKKCRIAKFDKNHFLFKNPNRLNELHKHFFPYCIKWMKKLTVEA